MKFKLIPAIYCLGIVSLFLFSFTQVDLSLTLSRVSVWQGIQRSFQHIGYFERPLSTYWYLATLVILFTSYVTLLKKGIEKSTLWKLIIFSSFLLFIAYNAFSYDIFNYIFYGKIITHYHQNPYLMRALDFPHDPMLSFMHWTHSTYPYGPFWLAVSVPLSLIGFNIFLLTFFIFKFFAAISYLVSCFAIDKILSKIGSKNNFGLVFFALNPLVIIESLVSGHNDIFMMALALCAIYFVLFNKKIKSAIPIVFSFLIKWATGVLFVPIALFAFGPKKFKNPEMLIAGCLLFSSLGLIYALTKYEMQPWYFLWIIPFVALFKKDLLIHAMTVFLSMGLLLTYALFFYNGNWDSPIPLFKSLAIVLSGVAGIVFVFLLSFLRKRKLINV